MAPSPLQPPRASALLPRHLTTTTPPARHTKRAETALRTPNHWTQPKPCGRSLQRAQASPLPRFPPAAPPSSALPCLRCASRPGMDPRSTFASTFGHAAPCAVPRRALRSALPHVGEPVRLCTLGGAFHVGERQAHFTCIPGALQAPQVQKLAKTKQCVHRVPAVAHEDAIAGTRWASDGQNWQKTKKNKNGSVVYRR